MEAAMEASMEASIQRIEQLQSFQVPETRCYRLTVTVQKGEKLSKGRIGDLMDTPDPYLTLYVKGIPRGKKRTTTISNNHNPSWNESFEFILDPAKEYVLDVSLHDANYTLDESFGTRSINLKEIEANEETIEILEFENGGKIHLKLLMEEDLEPDLRYSEDLCDDEKEFAMKRKELVLSSVTKILEPEDSPQNVEEVPVIGVLASGGGYRALIGYAGVLAALSKSRILDCVTYIAGLSGSSWCLAWLFSHPDFPNKGPGELLEELRDRMSVESYNSARKKILSHIRRVKEKLEQCQPVSLTDVFGHLVGEMLLKERKCSLFTDVREKLKDSTVPLPLCTCLNVKKDVSAKVFGEWIEFNPYEVGWSKYGIFMNLEYFGSVFYMGNIVHRYDELPLHFLLGCWGNAFSIIPERIMPGGDAEVSYNKQVTTERDVRDGGDSSTEARLPIVDEDSLVLEDLNGLCNGYSMKEKREKEGKGVSLRDRLWTGNEEDSDGEDHKSDAVEEGSVQKEGVAENGTGEEAEEQEGSEEGSSEEEGRTNGGEWWLTYLSNALRMLGLLHTRDVRAGRVFNPLRGLRVQRTKCVEMCSAVDGDFQKGLTEPVEQEAKEQCLVDSGLSFNLPFPLLLRPERGVDLYLSFDFSTRPTDLHEPFKEVILAEKWAKLTQTPFPPVKKLAQQYCREPMREIYLFEDPKDPNCPVILHFILFNGLFREYKEPGIKRETEEEKDFANFNIFSDPDDNYSMFKFNYEGLHFDRLSKLMEFNTLLGLEQVHEQMKKAVERRRNAKQNTCH